MAEDQYDEDPEVTDDGGDGEDENANIRRLRDKAKVADNLASENATLKKELAFTKAGLPDSKTAEFFRTHYDGDLTPEAIQAAARDIGILEDTGVAGEQERQGAEAMQAAATGGTPSAPTAYDDELASARSPEEAIAVMKKHGVTVQGT